MLLESIIKKELNKLKTEDSNKKTKKSKAVNPGNVESPDFNGLNINKQSTNNRELSDNEVNLVDAFGEIYEKFKLAEKEAKKLELELKDAKDRIIPLLHEFKELGVDLVTTTKFAAKISRDSSIRETVKYAEVLKEIVPLLEPKVFDLYEMLVDANTSFTYIDRSVDVKRMGDLSETKNTKGNINKVINKAMNKLSSIEDILIIVKTLASGV